MTTQEPDVKVVPQTTYVVVSDADLEKPYRVMIQNDDVTPMEFVVSVLRQFFKLPMLRAIEVMFQAHNEGQAYVATLPFKEAQQRIYAAHSAARAAGYPLTFYLEPES